MLLVVGLIIRMAGPVWAKPNVGKDTFYGLLASLRGHLWVSGVRCRLVGIGRSNSHSKVVPTAHLCGTLMMSEVVWPWHQRLFVGEHLGLGDWEGPHKVSQLGDERQGWLGDCGMDCSRRLFAY